MSLSFGLAFKKLGSADVGRIKNHNLRVHPTASQLTNEAAWFDSDGHQTIVAWDDSKIAAAKGLSKRKDAVVAIAFSIQLGAQNDWREAPTNDFPEGKPKPDREVFDLLCYGAKEWVIEEFGEDNLASMELHTDESTPHVQFVVTPIFEGKLQAKHWLNGSAACAVLRRKACDVMNRYVPCSYVPGNHGGEPHEPTKSAGWKTPENKVSGLVRFFKGHEKELKSENAELKERISSLEQALFSRKKTHYMKSRIEKLEAENEMLKQKITAKEEAFDALKQDHDNRFNVVRRGTERLKMLEAKVDTELNRANQLSLENEVLKLEVQALKPKATDAPLPFNATQKQLKPS